MNAALVKFKKIVAQVRNETEVNFGLYGLSDLLRDAGDDPSPARLAALAASYFCLENGRYNGSYPGVMVVIQFVSETCTSLGSGDATETLLRVLKSAPDLQQLMDWASGYYRP